MVFPGELYICELFKQSKFYCLSLKHTSDTLSNINPPCVGQRSRTEVNYSSYYLQSYYFLIIHSWQRVSAKRCPTPHLRVEDTILAIFLPERNYSVKYDQEKFVRRHQGFTELILLILDIIVCFRVVPYCQCHSQPLLLFQRKTANLLSQPLAGIMR